MKKFVCTIFICVVAFWGMVNVKAIDYANQIKFNYAYSRAISNTCYWIHSSASGFTPYINAAAADWASKSNPLNMTAVSSSYATHIDFYGKSNEFLGNDGTLGATYHYKNGGAYIHPNNGSWFYADIYLNLDTSQYNSVQGTCAHEIGHALGLAHWNINPYSIMAQTTYRLVNTVQASDIKHLNEIYP